MNYFVKSNFPQNSLGDLIKLIALDLVKVSLKVFLKKTLSIFQIKTNL